MDFSFGRTRARNIFKDNTDEADRLSSVKVLFNPPPMVNDTPDPDGSDNTDAFNRHRASKLLMDEYSAPSVATERYNKFLGDQPNEADYHASRKRTIAGILTGAALGLAHPDLGAEVGSKIITQPFDDKLADWTRREAPLKAAASSEGTAKTQRINSLKDFIQSQDTNFMNKSLVDDRTDRAKGRKITEARESAKLLDDIAYRQALERDKAADNARADAAAKALEKQREWERSHGNRTADIMEKNAATASTRASSYSRNVDNLIAHRDYLREQVKGMKGDTAAAQKTAEELATHEVILKPGNSQKYGNYFTQDDKGRIVITPPNKSFFDLSGDDYNAAISDYSRLRKEIDDQKADILKQNHPTNTKDQKPPVKPKILKRETVPENR